MNWEERKEAMRGVLDRNGSDVVEIVQTFENFARMTSSDERGTRMRRKLWRMLCGYARSKGISRVQLRDAAEDLTRMRATLRLLAQLDAAEPGR